MFENIINFYSKYRRKRLIKIFVRDLLLIIKINLKSSRLCKEMILLKKLRFASNEVKLIEII